MESFRSLIQLLRRYGVNREAGATERMVSYLELLRKWNRRVNLTASTEWPAIAPLFEEAVWAAGFYPDTCTRHLDIGSGAGFPAIPLRILRPEMRLWMIEPRIKRASFLESAAARLELQGTVVICEQVEAFLLHHGRPQFDVISWKGLKLSAEAVAMLTAAGMQTARFWAFHGTDLPFEDREGAERVLELQRRERFPGRTGWQISIYGVSRETS